MRHTPEEYGAYWAGAARMAIGVVLVLLVYHGVEPLTGHREWAAQGLGWVVLALAVFVGSFLVALGLARIIRAGAA